MPGYVFKLFLIVTTLFLSYRCGSLAKVVQNKVLDTEGAEGNRTGKLFAVYTVIPSTCRGPSSSDVSGVCYPLLQCRNRGGSSAGPGSCGKFATCCQFNFTSPSDDAIVLITEKVSTIQSNSDTTMGIFDVQKIDGYCQLRLDFHDFEFQPPNGVGECVNDELSFSGTVTVRNFVLCGDKPTRPLYLSYGPTSNTIRLSFRSANKNKFKVKVTQIHCDSKSRVPDSCLEQYDSTTGMISSFGFGKYQINPQEYNVCVGKRNAASTGRRITWEMCPKPAVPGITSSFFLTSYFGDESVVNGILGEGFGDATCERTSYVRLPQGDKYCGGSFRRAESGGLPNFLSVRLIRDDVERFRAANAYATIHYSFQNPPPTPSCVNDVAQSQKTIFGTCSDYPLRALYADPSGFMCQCNMVMNTPSQKRPTGFCLKYGV